MIHTDLTQLVAAVQALTDQVVALQKQVAALQNPPPPADVLTQAEVDQVLALVGAESEDLKAKLQALVAPTA